MPILMAIDIGGASRNGITIMNEKEQILYTDVYPYISKLGKGNHRREISKHIRNLVIEHKVERLQVERVNLFRGNNISKLANIESLSRLVSGITDATYDLCPIYDVAVQTWKSQVLGDTSKNKEPAIWYVKMIYKMDVVHDQADSICQAIYGIRNWYHMEKKQNISTR